MRHAGRANTKGKAGSLAFCRLPCGNQGRSVFAFFIRAGQAEQTTGEQQHGSWFGNGGLTALIESNIVKLIPLRRGSVNIPLLFPTDREQIGKIVIEEKSLGAECPIQCKGLFDRSGAISQRADESNVKRRVHSIHQTLPLDYRVCTNRCY